MQLITEDTERLKDIMVNDKSKSSLRGRSPKQSEIATALRASQ